MAEKGPIVNVAIIGAGEVSMVIHLPTLSLMPHMFKTVALMDISKQSLEFCKTKFHVTATYTDLTEMLARSPEIDLCIVASASEFHAAHAIQCLDAGKDVMIEKPMAMTLSQAEAIEEARKRAGKLVFVAYMRRYAPAFLRLKETLASIPREEINYVRLRNFTAPGPNFVNQSGCFPQRFMDFPAESGEERAKVLHAIFGEVLGPKANDPSLRGLWMFLNGLASHDISVLRELVGVPKAVVSAVRGGDNKFFTALLQYEGFVAVYETGIDNVPRVDAQCEILTKNKRLKITYDCSYIKGLPVTVTILTKKPNGDFSEEVIRPTYEDFYTCEYKELYGCLLRSHSAKTTAVDAREELVIFHMMLDALERSQGA